MPAEDAQPRGPEGTPRPTAYQPREDRPPCSCFVATLAPEVRFSVRWGAHAPGCPVYRLSADPVDRAEDAAFRARYARNPIEQWGALAMKHGPCKEWSGPPGLGEIFIARLQGKPVAIPAGTHLCSCDDSCADRTGIHRCRDCFARWRIVNPFTDRAHVVAVRDSPEVKP